MGGILGASRHAIQIPWPLTPDKEPSYRVGPASALVFLRLNGYALHVPKKELYALTMQIANKEADDDIVAAYLRSRIEAV